MFCINCGKQIESNFEFCPYCGTDMNKKNDLQMNQSDGSNFPLREMINRNIYKGDLDKAKQLIEKSLMHNPYNLEIQTLYEEIDHWKGLRIVNGKVVFYNPLFGCYDVVIPYGITEITENAFNFDKEDVHLQKRLHSVTMPSTLVKINKYAFSNCTGLVTVNLNVGLKEIASQAFHSCPNLETLNIPNTVEEIGFAAFFGCRKLNLIIPENVVNVNINALRHCVKSLKDNRSSLIKEKELEQIQNIRIQKGLCRYCGGKISFFNNKCRNCGKLKDYS